MAVLNSQLRLTLLDQVTARARGIMGTMRRMQAMAHRTNAAMRNMVGGGVLGGAMRTAAPFVGLYAAGRAFGSVVGAAANFEQSMNRVGVVSGATETQLKSLSDQAKELGRTTQFRASEAADAQGFLAMAGFNPEEILGAMPGTLNLAAAAGLELGNSADIVSNVLTGYRKPVSELGHVTDVLTKSFTSANTDLLQLGEAMKYAGPVASAAGVEFEEAAAVIGMLGNAGIQGSMAGTTLSNAIAKMVSPTATAQRHMRRLGLSFTNAEGRLLPFADIMEQLEPHMDDVGLMIDIFGIRAGRNMPALLAEGSDKMRHFTQELRDSKGAADEAASVTMSGFRGQMKAFGSAIEGVAIAIGERLNPSIESMVAGFTEGASNLTEFIGTFDNRVTIFDRVAAAYRGFVDGVMSGDGSVAMDRISRAAQSLKTMVFGSDVLDHQGELHRMREMSEAFRVAGANFAAFANSLASGDFRGAIRSLSDAFSEMNGWGTFATLYAGAWGMKLLAAATWVLVFSPIGRLAAVATAVAELIEAFRGAESFGEFVRNLSELSGVQWALIAAGVGLIAAKVWSLAAALGAVKLAGGLLALTRGAGSLMSAGRGPAAGVGTSRVMGPPAPGAGMRSFLGSGLKGGLVGSGAYLGGQWGINKGLDALDDALGLDTSKRDGIDTSTGGILNRLREGIGSGKRHPSPFDRNRGGDQSSIDLSTQSLAQMLKPGDRVDANIVNPPPRPNVTMPVTVYMQSGESPEDVGRRIGQQAAAEVSGAFSDGGV